MSDGNSVESGLNHRGVPQSYIHSQKKLAISKGGSSGPEYSKSRRLVVGESSLSHTRTLVKFRSLWFRPATVCSRRNSLASAANTLLLSQSLRRIGRPGNHISRRPHSSRCITCAPKPQSCICFSFRLESPTVGPNILSRSGPWSPQETL